MPLASAISNINHLALLNEVVKNELNRIDLTAVMVYNVEVCPASVLYTLADQFDVLGWKGWLFATTERQRRDLIKSAIMMHRLKGTPWSIKEACRVTGFLNPVLVEGYGQNYDGTYFHNGAINYSGGNWASFAIRLQPGDEFAIDANNYQGLIYLINNYKPASRTLIGITFLFVFSDGGTINDDQLELDGDVLTDTLQGIEYDGTKTYGGAYTHNKRVDAGTLTIYNQFNEILENGNF